MVERPRGILIMTDESPRYALYFAPDPSSPLWRFGSSVIGYDAASGELVEPLLQPDTMLSRSWSDLTEEPRRYGFHATLKAPFRLGEGTDEAKLIAAMHRFATDAQSVPIAGLSATSIGPFIALTPMGDETALNALASRIVKEFDIFRAPLSDADIARRLKSPLTPRQHEYLMQFGYPHVHEEFRFHMTLTGPLHEDDREIALAHLKAAFAREVPEPVTTIDRICLFRQAHAADKFKRVDCAPLR